MMSLFWNEIRLRRRSFVGWFIALAFFSNVYMIIYPALPPEIREIDPEALTMLKSMGVQTFATFEGFVSGTEFTVLPLIMGLFGVAMGISTLIGEENDGTLELLAALPVSRRQLILAKASSLLLSAFILIFIVGIFAVCVFLWLSIETDVTMIKLLAGVTSTWLICFVFFAMSLFLGAYLPTRAAALSIAMGILLVSFFGENLAGMVPVLEEYRPLFPFFYFKNIAGFLIGNIAWKDILILLGLGTVFLILAVWAFQRRNITVGSWP